MTIKIQGNKDLSRILKGLPDRLAAKVVRSATLSGAAIIRKEARSRVAVDDGVLIKSIAAKITNKTPESVTYSVGPTNKAFYGTFLEFGTESIRPQPFLRPAFDAKKDEAARKIEDRIMKGVIRESEKLRRGG